MLCCANEENPTGRWFKKPASWTLRLCRARKLLHSWRQLSWVTSPINLNLRSCITSSTGWAGIAKLTGYNWYRDVTFVAKVRLEERLTSLGISVVSLARETDSVTIITPG